LYYVIYNSVTMANRIKNHFRFDKDYIGVMHTPSKISVSGCSYSLKCKPEKLREILAVSEEFGIKVKGVFRQTGPDEFVEVPL
jgi:hypothetical protein